MSTLACEHQCQSVTRRALPFKPLKQYACLIASCADVRHVRQRGNGHGAQGTTKRAVQQGAHENSPATL